MIILIDAKYAAESYCTLYIFVLQSSYKYWEFKNFKFNDVARNYEEWNGMTFVTTLQITKEYKYETFHNRTIPW